MRRQSRPTPLTSTNPQTIRRIETVMAATAAAGAAGARDATRLEPLVCFFIILSLFFDTT